MIWAVYNDHPEIVEQLVFARADVNTKGCNGCALPPARSARVGGGRWSPMRRAASSGRFTVLHCAAFNGRTNAAVRLLVGGADQTITHIGGYDVPPTTTPTAAHRIGPNRRRDTPRQHAQANDKLAEYDAAVAQARRPPSRDSSRLCALARCARHACSAAARHAQTVPPLPIVRVAMRVACCDGVHCTRACCML